MAIKYQVCHKNQTQIAAFIYLLVCLHLANVERLPFQMPQQPPKQAKNTVPCLTVSQGTDNLFINGFNYCVNFSLLSATLGKCSSQQTKAKKAKKKTLIKKNHCFELSSCFMHIL